MWRCLDIKALIYPHTHDAGFYLVRHSMSTATKNFPPLHIPGLTDVKTKADQSSFVASGRNKPHHLRYPPVIKWTSIWPSAATFNYSVVPLPIRQGYCKNLAENSGISPEKYANAELMKIPNFLHLTKAHIQMHCAALKKFCTDWPSGLQSAQETLNHYPLEVIQHSYAFSASTLRDPRARIVSIKLPLSSCGLDDRAKRKLLRLAIGSTAGRKVATYCYKTDVLELTSGRCPTAKQNEQYLKYVLTVLVLESKKAEKWEQGTVDYDWLLFDWNRSQSRQSLLAAFDSADSGSKSTSPPEVLDNDPKVVNYQKALEAVWSENDILRRDQWPVRRYKQYRLRPAFPPLRAVPFLEVPAANHQSTLQQYATATRALFGLEKSRST